MAGGGTGGIKAGKAFVEIFANSSRLVRGLKAAQMKLRAFGASVRGMGMKMAGVGVALALPIGLAVAAFMKAGDALDKMSSRVGASVGFLSALGHAADIGGTSIAAMELGIRRLQRSALDAQRGLSTQKEAFDMLGVSVENADGSLKNTEQLFMETAAALSKMENNTQKAALAQMLFGRSGTALLPMLKDGKAGLIAMMKEAERLGIVMSGEDAEAAAELTDAFTRFKSVIKMTAIKIGAALAPMLIDLFKRFTEGAGRVLDFIKKNTKLIVTIAKLVGIVIAVGVGLVLMGVVIGSISTIIGAVVGGFGFLISALGTVMGVLSTVAGVAMGVLFNPITLAILAVVAGIVAIVWAFGGLGSMFAQVGKMGTMAMGFLGDTVEWLKGVFFTLRDDALAAFKGISDAMAAGDMALAAKVLWLTLKMEWQRGIAFLKGMWVKFKFSFLSIWNDAVFSSAAMMIEGQAKGMVAWIESIYFMKDAWTMFTTFMMKTYNKAIGWLMKQGTRFMSLFDETIDVDAQLAEIDGHVGDANQRLQDQQNETIGASDSARRKKLAETEEQRVATQDTLSQMEKEEEQRRNRQRDAELAGSTEELDKARDEWQAAMDEAAQARADADANAPPKKPGFDWDKFAADMDGLGDGIGGGGTKVQGSFNAFAIRGFGGRKPVDRIAKATERTADATEIMAGGGNEHDEQFD